MQRNKELFFFFSFDSLSLSFTIAFSFFFIDFPFKTLCSSMVSFSLTWMKYTFFLARSLSL